MSEEKDKTAAELEERERLAKQLEEEKKSLEEATSNLKGDLMVSQVPPTLMTDCFLMMLVLINTYTHYYTIYMGKFSVCF